ncbi:MAG: hypothetical protein CMH98_04925 [Oceanospirillaceae bacterium]|nr:hypothetical protein [Oceanospirillaceae bacterium]
MANFVLNTQRTFKQPVPIVVHDEDGNEVKGGFSAVFKILPNDELKAVMAENDDTRLIDLVLVEVSGIEVPGKDGQMLTGDELLNAVKNDPAANVAMIAAYQGAIAKKNQLKT